MNHSFGWMHSFLGHNKVELGFAEVAKVHAKWVHFAMNV